jgi:peptidoglycan hydrolase-like protein with peptidoglycan-binding domain
VDLKATDGPTGFAGQRLLDGIRAFQKQHGLVTDGRLNPGGPTIKALSQSLQSMGRKGDTVLAHLSPAEAQVLHAIIDGGSINPKTGLLEFWTTGDRDGTVGGSSASNAASGDLDRDAMAGNDYAERLKATSNARQARAAAASTTPSTNNGSNANIVGEKLKAMHSAREARMAAAPDRDDLEPFGPDNPTNVEKALAIRARKVLQQQQEEEKATKNPRFNRSYRNLLEDVQKRQPVKTTTPPSKLDEQKQNRPSISQQTANIEKQREIKAQRESEEARQAKARREANYGKPVANLNLASSGAVSVDARPTTKSQLSLKDRYDRLVDAGFTPESASEVALFGEEETKNQLEIAKEGDQNDLLINLSNTFEDWLPELVDWVLSVSAKKPKPLPMGPWPGGTR